MYNKGLFSDWVPKPVMLLLILLFLFPLLVVSGIYTANFTEMMSDLGVYSEHLSMANYASFIGMGAVLPLLLRFKMRFRSKELTVVSLFSIALCSIVIITTNNPYVIIFASFAIGLFKIIALIEFILPLVFLLGPNGEMSKFYTVFYPLSITISQLSTYLFAKVCYNLQWQSIYIIMAAIMLFLTLLAIIFMHNSRFSRKLPLYYIDWFSILLYVVSFVLLSYVLVFAKQQGWFTSPRIQWAILGFIFFFSWFIFIQSKQKRPFVPLSIFKCKNFIQGFTLLMALGLYLASTSIQNTFTIGVLGYNSITNNLLNYAMIPGVIVGGIYCFRWYKKELPVKFLILTGFLFYNLYFVSMYFLISPVIEIHYLILPMVMKGLGITILYISIWYYALSNFNINETLAAVALTIIVRSIISVAFSGAIYSWLYYKLQLQGLDNLAVHLDAITLSPKGGGLAVYGRTRLQALLTATKTVYGYSIITGILIMIYTLALRFEETHFRRLILLKKITRMESVKGYRFRRQKDLVDAMSAEAGAVPL